MLHRSGSRLSSTTISHASRTPPSSSSASFHDIGGVLAGWSGDDDAEQRALREAQLHGFPSPLPQAKDVDWELIRAWDEELEKAQAQRPRTMPGIERVADVEAIVSAILPFRVTNSDKVRMQAEEVTRNARDTAEQELIKMLDYLGY